MVAALLRKSPPWVTGDLWETVKNIPQRQLSGRVKKPSHLFTKSPSAMEMANFLGIHSPILTPDLPCV